MAAAASAVPLQALPVKAPTLASAHVTASRPAFPSFSLRWRDASDRTTATAAATDPPAEKFARPTESVASRLSKQVECPIDPQTPHFAEGALMPSSQPRLVANAAPPHAVCFVNKAWEDATGSSAADVVGRPVLSVVNNKGIRDALRLRSRGCAGGVTASPLMDAAGDVTHMIFVLAPGS
jgi:hypothetical protein